MSRSTQIVPIPGQRGRDNARESFGKEYLARNWSGPDCKWDKSLDYLRVAAENHHIPIEAVSAEDAFLFGYDLVRRGVAHREPISVDAITYTI